MGGLRTRLLGCISLQYRKIVKVGVSFYPRPATWFAVMEGQFEDAFPVPEEPVPSKGIVCPSEEEVDSDWSEEGDYEPYIEDYNWENEVGDFSKKLAAVRRGTQPNSNRRQPFSCGDHSNTASSKTFAVSTVFAVLM